MSEIKVVNTETNEEQIREKTPIELTRDENDQEKLELERENIFAKGLAKVALLQKIGLTEEEAKLLLS